MAKEKPGNPKLPEEKDRSLGVNMPGHRNPPPPPPLKDKHKKHKE